jgi:GT2 family glycosyltransferase
MDSVEEHRHSPAVTAIVLHWKDPAATRRCVESLLQMEYPNLTIVVVENGSHTDWAWPEARGPQVVRSAQNSGYAGGNNLGLRSALTHGSAYALLINNDAVMRPDAIGHMVRCAERDQRIALVGAKLLRTGDPTRQSGSYGRITYGPFLVRIHGAGQLDPAADRDSRDVEWVSGCCLLVRLAALTDIGFLDEQFFLYNEDVDWCLRARRQGYRVVFEPRAVALHESPASLDATCRRAYFLARNGLLFARKHASFSNRLKTIGFALALPGASLLRRLVTGAPLLPAKWATLGVIDGLLRRPPRLRALGLRQQ